MRNRKRVGYLQSIRKEGEGGGDKGISCAKAAANIKIDIDKGAPRKKMKDEEEENVTKGDVR